MSKKLSVLIVDDDQVNNFVLKNVIERSYPNSSVEIKINGKEGLNYLYKLHSEKKAFPNILLVDIYMPIANGFEFLDIYEKKFQDKYDSIIFMISSSLSKEDQVKANSYKSVKGYITKPLINNNIEFIVEKYL